MILVKYEDLAYDNMKITGFCQMTEEEFDKYLAAITTFFKEYDTFVFKLNADDDIWYHSEASFKECIRGYSIDSHSAATIKSELLGWDNSFGFFPQIEDFDL
jgi:hypothetical protein